MPEPESAQPALTNEEDRILNLDQKTREFLAYKFICFVLVVAFIFAYASPPGGPDRLHENPFLYHPAKITNSTPFTAQNQAIENTAYVSPTVRTAENAPFTPVMSAPTVNVAPMLLNSLKPNYQLRTRSSRYDLPYEGVYFFPGELNLNPFLKTRANWWMEGEYSAAGKQGCFGDPVGNTQLQIASWFYPCGSIVEVYNPLTKLSVFAEVTDRGPNRFLKKAGWENNRVREYGVDITRAVATAIGQKPGEIVWIKPIQIPDNQPMGPVVDLTTTSPNYTGINTMTGELLGQTGIQDQIRFTLPAHSQSKI